MAEAIEVSEIKQDLSLVCPSDIVFSDPGDDVVLLCHLEPAISAVSMEIKWWNKSDLVCHYKDGQMIESCEGRVSLPLQDLHNGNVSLTLRDVRRSQKGHYICEVIYECKKREGNIFLHIRHEHFSLVTPGAVSADPGEDVILPVHLSPETGALSMKIKWVKGTEFIYQYMNGQEKTNSDYEKASLSIQELERGNLSLTLRNVQQTDSGDYTCKVFQEECLHTGTVHLEVREHQKSENTWKDKHLPDPLRQLLTDETPLHKTLDHGKLATKRKYNEDESSNKKRYKIHLIEEEDLSFHSSGPTPRRRNSMDGNCPLMSDDSTLERHKLEEEEEDIALSEATEHLNQQRQELNQSHQLQQQQEMESQGRPLPRPSVSPVLVSAPTTARPAPLEGKRREQLNIEEQLQWVQQLRQTCLSLLRRAKEERERGGQSTRQISEGNTATEQDSPCTTSHALQRERPSESVSAGATQTQVSPGASMQSTHEWTQESVAAEQERSSPAVQLQVQEGETTSESATAGHTTQTPERPEDTTQRR